MANTSSVLSSPVKSFESSSLMAEEAAKSVSAVANFISQSSLLVINSQLESLLNLICEEFSGLGSHSSDANCTPLLRDSSVPHF